MRHVTVMPHLILKIFNNNNTGFVGQVIRQVLSFERNQGEMSKSRKWRKAVLEWLKEMWRSCVGCNTKSGEWMLPYKAEIFGPPLVAMVFLVFAIIIAFLIVIFVKCIS